ncbi:MAG: hypothetical protein C0594_06995 [Marinilabiliales bacterium]|nr:MAG: hypothetical protein C0594_06995 [Marinilabiliales bacterium]
MNTHDLSLRDTSILKNNTFIYQLAEFSFRFFDDKNSKKSIEFIQDDYEVEIPIIDSNINIILGKVKAIIIMLMSIFSKPVLIQENTINEKDKTEDSRLKLVSLMYLLSALILIAEMVIRTRSNLQNIAKSDIFSPLRN